MSKAYREYDERGAQATDQEMGQTLKERCHHAVLALPGLMVTSVEVL